MQDILWQLTVIVTIAAGLSLVVRRLGQPLIVSYLITGVLVGPAFLGVVHERDALEVFGKIGVALLLFLVGLRLQPKVIREVGSIAVLTGLGQVVFTTVLGFGLAIMLGFSTIPALYLATAFTFSSTIVIFQLLYAKEEQDTLYGKIATGLMLVQDIVAIILFLFLSSAVSDGNPAWYIATVVAKAAAIVLAVMIIAIVVVPRVDRYFAETPQVLFLFALAVCFLFAMGSTYLGFSVELGALLAGVVLSLSPYQREIASRIHPLRDFFLVMFFVVLGTQVEPASLAGNWGWIIAFSAFILVGNPLIVMLIMRPAGYNLRTSFFAGLTVAQISEFSLILVATAVSIGHLPQSVIGPVTMIGLITIFGSSYFIMHNETLYRAMRPLLAALFGGDSPADAMPRRQEYDVILFGCHRLGEGIVDVLHGMRLSVLVVDHNPAVIAELKERGVPCLFGSADSMSFLSSLPLSKVRLIISTIPEVQANLTLTTFFKTRKRAVTLLCVAYHERHATELYEAGATYVIVPPYLGRRYLIDLLRQHRTQQVGYRKERVRHERDLAYRKSALELPTTPR